MNKKNCTSIINDHLCVKTWNTNTWRKSTHWRGDFLYRETKLLYREKKYSFKGRFPVPVEFDRFIKSFSEGFSNYKSWLFIRYATTILFKPLAILIQLRRDNGWHFPYREKVSLMPLERISSFSVEVFCLKSLSDISFFFSSFFNHEVALALFVGMSDLLPWILQKAKKETVFQNVFKFNKHALPVQYIRLPVQHFRVPCVGYVNTRPAGLALWR